MNYELKTNGLKKGFTLVELLVVIGIIGVLTTVLLVNFNGVRQRNRDAKRKADIKEMQAAYELYRSDWSKYPSTGEIPGCGGSVGALSTVYLRKLPCDPQTNQPYTYTPTCALGTCTQYVLSTCLENTRDKDAKKVSGSTVSCSIGTSTGVVYEVTNP